MAHTTSSRDEIFLKYVLIESGRAIRHFDKTFQLASEVSVTPVGESREFLSVLDALHAGLRASSGHPKEVAVKNLVKNFVRCAIWQTII